MVAIVGHRALARGTPQGDDVIELDTRPLAPPPSEAPVAADEPASPHGHSVSFPTHKHDYPVPPGHDETPHDPRLVHVFAGMTHPTPAEAEEAPAVVLAPEGAPVHFVMSVGSTIVSHGGLSASQGAQDRAPAGAPEGPPEQTVPESHVSVPARLLTSVTPAYPAAARSAEIEADVPIEIVVDTRGVVAEARLLHSAGYGFDEAALSAVRAYRFRPAQREGHPVRVRMRWPVVFRLN